MNQVSSPPQTRVDPRRLQRLVFDEEGFGMACAESSLFESTRAEEEAAIAEAEAVGRALGVSLDAPGAAEPGLSLTKQIDDKPWSLCRRPWSLMYFTAHGRALPCSIAPFSARGYETYTLGDATQEDIRAQLLGDTPPKPCQSCGLRWSL